MAFKFLPLLGFLTLSCLLAPLVFASDVGKPYPVSLVVHNSLTDQKNVTFTTDIAYRGILLGAMRRIQESNNGFKFTIKDDPDYGPFIESVNGVAGKESERTYWELLVQLQNGTVTRPDVGVGCYIPNPHDIVIFKFTTW